MEVDILILETEIKLMEREISLLKMVSSTMGVHTSINKKN